MAAHTASSSTTNPSAPPRGLGFSWIRVSILCAAAAALVAYLGSATTKVSNRGAVRALSQATQATPVWEPIEGARPLFGVDLADNASVDGSYRANRHRDGGREDGLLIGSPENGTFGRVDIARGPVGSEPANLYVDAVRRAAASGASVMRIGQSLTVETKFGGVEAAPALLSAGSERACLAFRFSHGELALRLHGFLCSTMERTTTAQELACFIDGLAYLGGTDDPALKVLFAQADKRRGPGCGPAARTVAARRS